MLRYFLLQHIRHKCLQSSKSWNGSFFAATTLKALGLRVQLNHPPGESCTNPAPAFDNDFTVIHTSGIHSISLDFCGCQRARDRTRQLLRSRLFPATTIDPQTAATFSVLQLFQLLSFMSKISALEFYQALSRTTNNFGCEPPVCYRSVFVHQPLLIKLSRIVIQPFSE